MSVSLLAPLALLGGLLVAVPVILHLIDRRRVPRLDFPAIRFLMAAQKRLKRRRRIREPWLLLIRLVALAALVLAYASPVARYMTSAPAGADLDSNVVFLLDNSMSMGYKIDGETLFDRAKARAESVLGRMAGQGRAGLVVFNRAPEDVTAGVTQNLGKVRDGLERVSLSHGETDLEAALLTGLRALLATPEGRGDLYLLSDLCAHALPGKVELSLPAQLEGRVRLVVSVLDEGSRSNRSVVGVRIEREGGEGGNIKLLARVRRQGEGLAGEVPLDLMLNGEAISRGFVSVPEQETVTKTFTLPARANPSGDGVLALGDDSLEADNRFFFKLPNRRGLQALVIDGDPGDSLSGAEAYFVERALNPKKSSGSRISPVVVGDGSFARLDPREVAVVFMLNVADPGPWASRLTSFVEHGGGLFIALGDRVRGELYNRALSGLLPASIGEVKAASPDLTGETSPALSYPETGHPIFQVFREAGAPVFGTISFHKLFPTAPVLKPDAEVLLKFTNGLPALLERSVGAGRVLMFTSTLDRGWTNFPLKSVFLPFVQEAAHYLAHNPSGELDVAQHTAGHPVVLQVAGPTRALEVIDPSGVSHPIKASMPEKQDERKVARRVIFRDTDLPGHYRVVERGGLGTGDILREDLSFVANVSEREIDLTLASIGELRERLTSLPVVVEGQVGDEDRVQVERTTRFNYGLLWGFLAFLALEGLLIFWRRPARGGQRTDSVPGPAQQT